VKRAAIHRGVAAVALLAASMAWAGETVRVSGADEGPILAAIQRLARSGGVVEIEAGEYLIRRELKVPSGLTLRGVQGGGPVVLRLPSPTRITAPAKAGDTQIIVEDATPVAANTTIDVQPPTLAKSPVENNAKPVAIVAIEGRTLKLGAPLKQDYPAGSRVGYDHQIISVRDGAHDVTIEHLVLDGGRVDAVPMHGHQYRNAIWAVAPYAYEKGPTGPPVARLTIRGCEIRNTYGRAVAFYNVVDSTIENCRAKRIGDESLDLDHFTYRCKVIGNTVEDADTGATINDGSENIVRGNTFINCHVGVTIWRWKMCQQPECDRNNVVEDNTIASRGPVDISVGENCKNNTIRGNRVKKPIKAKDPSTVVEGNIEQK
jgi:parallel beta-helix repeat protein